MKILAPSTLLAFYRTLPWDERGLLNEIPAGGHDTYGNTHTDLGDPYGPPLGIYNPFPNVNGADKAMTYSRPIDASWVIPPGVPPRGTAVWQVKDNFRIVRTSIIQTYGIGRFVIASLSPAGPHPGVPIGGDSGSICFVRHEGRWLVLGIVNFGRSVSLPRWTTDLEAGDYTIRATTHPNFTAPHIAEVPSKYSADWGTLDTDMSPESIMLPSVPITKRVMGRHSVGDDGTDSIKVFVPHSFPSSPSSVQILGRRAGKPTLDEWRYPDTGNYWHVRAARVTDGLFLYFKPSQDNDEYFVTIDGSSYTVTPSTSAEPPTPPPVGTPAPAPWDAEKAALLNRITTLEGQRDTLERRLAVLQTELDAYKRAGDALRTLINP